MEYGDMFGFGKKKKDEDLEASVASVKNDLDALSQDMTEFKLRLEDELAEMKSGFNSLVRFFEEGQAGDSATEDENDENERPPLTEADIHNMKQDLRILKKSVMDIIEWTETVAPEFKSIQDRIEAMGRDVKNKITYAVARLKS